MPWFGWLLLASGLFVVLTVAVYRVIRATRRGRRFLALPLRAKLRFGRLLLADPAIPLAARLVVVGLVAYLALPFDLIPDFIPVLGQADDLAVIILAVGLLLVLVPGERFEAAATQAEAEAAARATTT